MIVMIERTAYERGIRTITHLVLMCGFSWLFYSASIGHGSENPLYSVIFYLFVSALFADNKADKYKRDDENKKETKNESK